MAMRNSKRTFSEMEESSSSSSSCCRTDMDDLKTLLSEQRHELVSAQALETDLNMAFDLQMQEAITASLALQPSPSPSSSSSPSPSEQKKPEPELGTFIRDDDEYGGGFSFAALVAEEVDRLEQECRDREMSEAEMRKMRDDLNRRIHDQKVASDIMRIPEAEWKNDGDNYEMPYCEAVDESFRVYIKGLVSEERVKDSTVTVAAIGVAICDFKDNLIFELRKPLVDGEDKSLMSAVEVGLKALIEGLSAAIALDLRRVSCFCDEYMIHQYVTENLPATPSKISKSITDVMLLRAKFTNFTLSLVARNDIKFAFKLARDAIVSQITWPSKTGRGKNLMETCVICFDDTVVGTMFSVDGCLHRFCFSCIKQHVEVKLLSGLMAKCPQEGCKSKVNIDTCREFLDPKLMEIMRQRTKEASVPVAEKVYCPYPKCSALMSKREVLEYTNKFYVGSLPPDGARKCTKCRYYFCINCKVPWHNNMTCFNYKRSNPNHSAEDAKLKSLATKKLWRQCVKCNHMIELGQGCYHIFCRCGYEFCYNCGAEWKNKKATCKCPLWAEPNILYDQRRRG